MAEIVRSKAIYEEGRLLLLEPVALVEGQEVELALWIEQEMRAVDCGSLDDPQAEEAILRLVLGNMIEWPSREDDSDAWVEALAEEIDQAYQGKPLLSEMIIEDRGEL